MSTLQDRVFDYLTDAFVAERTVDPTKSARALQSKFPTVSPTELADTVRLIANGLGVRVKEKSREHAKTAPSSCA